MTDRELIYALGGSTRVSVILGVASRTVRRWVSGEKDLPDDTREALKMLLAQMPAVKNGQGQQDH